MDKTVNINIAGTLFQIDDEAFRILRDYLQAINNRFKNVQGGHETIEDIESRVSEIFQSQKGLAGVISKENVEAMIAIIGKPDDFDHGESEPEQTVYTSHRRRMYRNPDDSIISGVCGGLGAYLNTDPVLFRILFAISALVFGTGFLVYIILWIALPPANTETQKRELFGNNFHSGHVKKRQPEDGYSSGASSYSSGNDAISGIGNAINEVFKAIGRVCYIILRVFLIIIGVVLVLTGFLFILSFVMVFVFKYPGAFSIDDTGFNMIYFPDFLNYIVNPAVAPWIMILSSIAIILPVLALIYWGVKMIFWFKAQDGIFSLVALVIWVMTIAALSIILFNEGTSFAKTAKVSTELTFPNSPDTIYILTDHKISDLKFEKEIGIPHEDYKVLISEEKKELYIRPSLTVNSSDDNDYRLEVRKRSAGRNEMDAMKKIDGLLYNYSIKNDTLLLDEYFTSPEGRKWSADNIGINLYVPVGTVLKIDRNSNILFHSRFHNRFEEYSESGRRRSFNSLWVLTDDGLEPVEKAGLRNK